VIASVSPPYAAVAAPDCPSKVRLAPIGMVRGAGLADHGLVAQELDEVARELRVHQRPAAR
jgi:hypothetical protein